MVLTVPGWTSSGPGHWQTLWERANPDRFRRVEQRDWDQPRLDDWVRALDDAIAAEPAPVVLAAHSLGCIAIAHWAARFARPVAGALLVAPADVERGDAPEPVRNFAPVPPRPLPFRSILVASDDDPWLTLERAEHFARQWGSELARIGAAGHINTDAGFGPWPHGERLLASHATRACVGSSSGTHLSPPAIVLRLKLRGRSAGRARSPPHASRCR